MLNRNPSLSSVPATKPAQEPEARKTSYSAPQLFAVAQTVELIQGYHWVGRARDYWNSNYYA